MSIRVIFPWSCEGKGGKCVDLGGDIVQMVRRGNGWFGKIYLLLYHVSWWDVLAFYQKIFLHTSTVLECMHVYRAAGTLMRIKLADLCLICLNDKYLTTFDKYIAAFSLICFLRVTNIFVCPVLLGQNVTVKISEIVKSLVNIKNINKPE